MSDHISTATPMSQSAPIFRLPADVLLELFESFSTYISPQIQCFSHVCHSWRELIHRHEPFWTVIKLRLCDTSVEKAEYWLARAGPDTSLDISLHALPQRGEAPPVHPHFQTLFHVLRRTVERWRKMEIQIHRDLLVHCAKLCVGNASRLERLTIDGIGEGNDEKDSTAGTFVDISLRCARPSGVIASFAYCVPKFHSTFGSSLTRLRTRIGGIYMAQHFLDMLRSCPNLIAWTLEGDSRYAIVEEVSPVLVHLPHLVDLTIKEAPGSASVVKRLMMPSLEKLHVEGQEWSEYIVDIGEYLLRTSPSLSNLAFVIANPLASYLTGRYMDVSAALLRVTRFAITPHPLMYDVFFDISLPNLEVLDISSAPAFVARYIMQSSPLLQSITLTKINNPSFIHISLPHLQTLNIDFLVDSFRNLEAPQLEHLYVDIDGIHDDEETNDGAHLRAFIERSRPPLCTMRLLSVAIGDDDLLGCLAMLPQLTSLEVSSSNITDATLEALTVRRPPANQPDASDYLLPHLIEVELRFNRAVTPTAFDKFLSSRGNPPSTVIEQMNPLRFRADVVVSQYRAASAWQRGDTL
ncbi:hypothetical protein BOTBODRAFT_25826 [Botryobasidium botryosum FD-172 SS1]|uniref:F-box domain-containing protein n=1 Tax=Botryobasidium botryosum (strain FD-172 SS1) TaxID=930990 RepID=A0A067NCA3_BOTB1|nr:hypothetical protein BOTBODRAFT_25826 [Botryobasidium botryosum FD-172 SS1]